MAAKFNFLESRLAHKTAPRPAASGRGSNSLREIIRDLRAQHPRLPMAELERRAKLILDRRHVPGGRHG